MDGAPKAPSNVLSAPLLTTPGVATPLVASPVVYTPPSARQHTQRLNRSSQDSTGRHGHGRNKSMSDWFKPASTPVKKVWQQRVCLAHKVTHWRPFQDELAKDEVFSPASVSKAVAEER